MSNQQPKPNEFVVTKENILKSISAILEELQKKKYILKPIPKPKPNEFVVTKENILKSISAILEELQKKKD